MTLLEVLILLLTLAVVALAVVFAARIRQMQNFRGEFRSNAEQQTKSDEQQQPEMMVLRTHADSSAKKPDARILKLENELDVLYNEMDIGKVKDWDKRESELIHQMVTIFMNDTESHISGSN